MRHFEPEVDLYLNRQRYSPTMHCAWQTQNPRIGVKIFFKKVVPFDNFMLHVQNNIVFFFPFKPDKLSYQDLNEQHNTGEYKMIAEMSLDVKKKTPLNL